MMYEITPFVKWVGGKRQLIEKIKKRMPRNYNKYFEPFVGGGALFMELQPSECYINDANSELISAYNVMKSNPQDLMKLLDIHENNHSKSPEEYFYEIRKMDRNANWSSVSVLEKVAKEYGIEEYVNILLAIIQVESGGTAEDVMQSSESLGLPPNSLSTEESIKQGVKYFSELLASSERLGVDLESVIQSYNYGGGFLGYVANRGNKYTFELAQSFSKEYSGDEKVSYPNPIAIPINGGWRYNYGNMFYVQLVTQYLVTTEFNDDTVQAIMDEALKFEGWKYVYGGASPTTSFDCSGLTQWTYGKAGINLPRTAQQQYDVTRHIPLLEAKAGDLVFFHSTYNAGSYII